MYEALKDFSHPVTGRKVLQGEVLMISCQSAVRILLKAEAIKKIGN